MMKLPCRHVAGVIFLTVALAVITACGGDSASLAAPTYSIGGTLSGLDPGQSVVFRNNGGDDLPIGVDGPFTFATKVKSGSTYAVSVSAPSGMDCSVTGGAGQAFADVTNVNVVCATASPFSIGGSVSGLVGQGLELKLYVTGYVPANGEFLRISGNGHFAFQSTPDRRGFAGHAVRIESQPQSPDQRCVVQNPYLELTAANFAEVDVVCGEFSYVTNAGSNTLSAFSIDATSGALAVAGLPVAAGLLPNQIAATMDKKYLYTANSGSNDVSAWFVDRSSGVLTTVPGSPFAAVTNPKAVSTITTRVSNTRGNRNYLFSFLYVANAGSDNLSAYQIDQSTGALTPLSPASYATGAGPSAMAIDPASAFLYAANTGGSHDISAFEIDGLTGILSPISGSPFLSGSNVTSLAFGAAGAFLYAADASGGTAAIYGFKVDKFGSPTGGSLTNLAGFPYPLTSCTFIVADQTGAYLYATVGTNVLGYSIDEQTGALSPLSGFPLAIGANAASLSVDPTNQFLYVANGTAGTVTAFKLDAASGALALIPGSPFAVGNSADVVTTF